MTYQPSYFCDCTGALRPVNVTQEEIDAWAAERDVEVVLLREIFEVPHPLAKLNQSFLSIVSVTGWWTKDLALAKEFANRFGDMGVWEGGQDLIHRPVS